MKNLSLKRESFLIIFSFIFLNLSSQSFTDVTPSVLQPTQQDIYDRSSAIWIDIDNDKDLDLLFQRKLYKNLYPTLDFEEISLPFLVESNVAFGDYNNDGLIDAAVPYGSVTTFLFKNIGNCSFEVQADDILPFNSSGRSIDWGDYDNDGDLDLIIGALIIRNNGSNSFTRVESIILKDTWNGISKWGDYNNDGLLDVIVTGITGDGLATSIYKNNGNNSFTELTGTTIPGFNYGSIEWGDYDDDGDLDLLITAYIGGYIQSFIYKNNGNDSFSKLSFPALFNVWRGNAAWGDYDADGDLDIIIGGYQGMFNTPVTGIYNNNGNDAFELQDFTIEPVGSGSAVWGDYDNDGDLDIAIISARPNASNAIETVAKLFRNDIGVTNSVPAAPNGLSAEVNNFNVYLKWGEVKTDNTPYTSITYDLKIGTTSGGSEIMQSNSDADGYRKVVTFGNAWQNNTATLKLPYGTYFWSVQAIDNGYTGGPFSLESQFTIVPVQARSLSAIILDPTSLRLKWKRGTGERCVVFCNQTTSGTATPSNNKTYLADSEFGSGSQIGTTGWFTVYNGRADSVVVTGLILNKPYSFHIFEYSGISGTEQYMTLTSDGNPGIFSTSMFTEQTAITASVNSGSNNNAFWGDYDNDGYLDVFVLGFPSKIYKNNGDNTFTEISISFPSIERGTAAWGDYDNDGDLDIAISGLSTTPLTTIYENKGGDQFEELLPNAFIPVCWSSIAWGDYDNDGDLDLLINGSQGSAYNTDPVTKVYKNNSDGSFTEQTAITLRGLNKGSVNWADYDNDGDFDIINSGSTSENVHKTEIYRNDGNENFIWQDQITIQGRDYSSVSPGDYDKDGDLDLLISYDFGVLIYENKGNDTFENVLNYQKSTGTYESPSYADWIDYNNDGYLDFVFTNPPAWFTRVYRNTKGIAEQGSISDWFVLQDGSLKNTGNGYVNTGDYDNDGDADILLSLGNKFSIIANNFIMKSGVFHPNTNYKVPYNTNATNTPTGVVLSWDPVTGDETTSEAMTYNVKVGTSETFWDICPSQSLSNGYRLVPTMGNGQTGTTFVLKNLPSGTYYWSVQAVDQGLKGSGWSPAKIFEVKNVQAFFSSDQVCMGLPSHFTDESVATKGIASWAWDFGDGTTSTEQNPEHTYSESGTYTVQLLITDTEAAEGSIIHDVIVKPRPVTGFTAATVCQGIATTFTNTTDNNGLTVSSWFWDFGNGQTSTIQNPPPHPYLGAADYSVVLKAEADNGCIDEITKTITVATIPSAGVTADAPLTFCSGESVTLSVPSNSDYTYYWSRGGSSITDAVTNTYTAEVSGSYTATVINTKGNCTSVSSSVSVVANNAPAAPLISAGGDQTFCQGDAVVLSAAYTDGYSYQWKLNGGAVGTNSNQYSANASGTYSLVVTNASNCSVYAANTVDITVNPVPSLPSVNISGPTTFCQGSSVELSVSSVSGYTYQWENNGAIVSGATSNTYTANTSGIYSLRITNSSDCFIRTENVTVNVLEAPSSPAISPVGPITFCQDDAAILSVTNTAGYSYKWKLNGGDVGTNSNQYSANVSGTYSLVVTNPSACSVNSANSVVVTVNPKPILPTVNISGSTTFCQGGSVELSVPATSGYTYQWENNGAGITGATANALVAVESGIYSLKIINSSNCFIRTDNATVNVLAGPSAPSISVTGLRTFCEGDSAILSVTKTTGYNYTWKLNTGTVGTNSNKYIAKSSGAYSLIVTNPSGCSVASGNTITITVRLKPTVPTVNIGGPTTFCQGASVELSVSNNPAYTYQWINSTISVPGAQTSTYLAQTSGVYSLKITNSSNCFVSTENTTVNVLEAPSAPSITVTGDKTFCQGSSALLSVTETAGYTYQWKFNGGTVGGNSSQFTALNAGVYHLIVTNTNNCFVSSSDSVTVVVNPLPAISAITLSGSPQFCDGGNITLSITSTAGYSYNWRNEDGLISGAGTNTYLAETSGKYQVDISNSAGCTVKTSAVEVTVAPMPAKPAIDPGDYQKGKCLGETPITIGVSNPITGYNYEWYRNGVPISNSNNILIRESLQQGIYKLKAELGECAVESDTLNILFDDAPDKPLVYAEGPSVWYLACNNEEASAYKWYFNGEVIPGADSYLYVANHNLGKYNVSISNTKGCFTMSDTISIPKGTTGIEDPDPFENMIIYPNPSSGLFTIELSNQLFGSLTISIFDPSGKEVINLKTLKTAEHFEKQIDLTKHGEGMYLVKTVLNKHFDTRKIIVK